MEEPTPTPKYKGKFSPHDQYDLSAGLLDEVDDLDTSSPNFNIRFNSLLGKQILLSNIGEKMLPLEQEKVRNLVSMFDMARRSRFFLGAFRRSYFGWKHQLALTRAKNGKASDQAFSVAAGYPKQGANYVGFQGLQEEIAKEEKGILGKLFAPRQQQQQPR